MMTTNDHKPLESGSNTGKPTSETSRRNMLAMAGLGVVGIGAASLMVWGTSDAAFAQAAKNSLHVATDIVEGADDAPVTIIEYASMTCPHCANFHINTWPALKERYVDTGKVKFIFRDFPFDRAALNASMLARCGGKERHSGFIDMLFQQQNDWGTSKTVGELNARLGKIAKFGGIGDDAFTACMEDKELETAILEGRVTAQNEFKVQSTPSFIINGKLHSGAMEIDAMAALIDPLLPTE